MIDNMKIETGKITSTFFKDYLLNKTGRNRKEVLIGPKFGVDVSIIDLNNGQALAMASDPLTLIPSLGIKESAWLSIQLTANDIATTGLSPMYAQFVMNLPEQLSPLDFNIYWDAIHNYCNDMAIAITGGHTGFIPKQNSTTPGGATFIAIGQKEKMLTSNLAQVEDAILITKTAALSASAILAMCFPETVKNKVGIENYDKACKSFYDISVLKEALITTDYSNSITAMHDVTEGGILGAIYEMVIASNKGAVIYNECLPIGNTQAEICNLFSIDPRYCVGAGALVITCKKEAVKGVIQRLQKENILCTEVGKITKKQEGIHLIENEIKTPIIYNQKDPYWNAFFTAINKGWK